MLRSEDRRIIAKEGYHLKGTFGPRVYLVCDIDNKEYICKKVFARKKFKVEADLGKIISQTHIVQLFSSFQESKHRFLLLEACTNGTLHDILSLKKRFNPPETRCLIRQIVMGLSYLHNRCILHRNLNLHSILFDQSMVAKIGCFGHSVTLKTSLDKIYNRWYKNEYFNPPEMLDCSGYGLASDVWAVGCLMQYAIEGMLLITQDSKYNLRGKKLQKVFQNKKFGKHTQLLLKCLLSINPENRPTAHCILDFDYFNGPSLPTLSLMLPYKTDPNVSSGMKIDKLKFPLKDRTNLDTHWEQGNKSEITGKENVTDNKQQFKMLKNSPKQNCICEKNLKIQSLYEIINAVVENGGTSKELKPVPIQNFLCVSCWVIIQDENGFGYHLSDGSVGVQYSDGTQLLRKSDGSFFYFDNSNITTFQSPHIPQHLQNKINFARLIDIQLHTLVWSGPLVSWANTSLPTIYILQWILDKSGIIMVMSNGSLQVNFSDHEKFLLNAESESFIVMSDNMEGTKNYVSYNLKDIWKYGVPEKYKDKMDFVLRAISDLKSGQGLYCSC